MSKKYIIDAPRKVRKEDLTGGGRCYYMTTTIERILLTRLYDLEYYQKKGRAGLKMFPGTDEERLKFAEKLDKDLEDIKNLREIFPEKGEGR